MSARDEGIKMRLIAIIVIAILFVSSGPALAIQKSNRGQCRRLTKQMSQHTKMMEIASARQNADWASSLKGQIARMEIRRDRLCPDIAEGRIRKAYEEWKAFLKLAGETALKYFTFGAY